MHHIKFGVFSLFQREVDRKKTTIGSLCCTNTTCRDLTSLAGLHGCHLIKTKLKSILSLLFIFGHETHLKLGQTKTSIITFQHIVIQVVWEWTALLHPFSALSSSCRKSVKKYRSFQNKSDELYKEAWREKNNSVDATCTGRLPGETEIWTPCEVVGRAAGKAMPILKYWHLNEFMSSTFLMSLFYTL